jgi:hypothetical protein
VLYHFFTATTDHTFQTELAIDTNAAVSSLRDNVDNTNDIVSDIRHDVGNTNDIVSDIRCDVGNTHNVVNDTYNIVSDIHRTMVGHQQGTDSENQLVSNRYPLFIARSLRIPQ